MFAFMLFVHKRREEHHTCNNCEHCRARQKKAHVHKLSHRRLVISIVIVNHRFPLILCFFFAAPRSPPRGKIPPLYFIQLVELCQPLFFCMANNFQQEANPLFSIFHVFIHIRSKNRIQFFSHVPVDNFILHKAWNFNTIRVRSLLSRASYPHIFLGKKLLF